MGSKSMLLAPAEESAPPPTATAASVAKLFFEKELKVHEEGSKRAKDHHTVVILQDDCYGHRYSRPRTSRANLSTIVERPERIHASVLGLATAYVRLGGRHAESAMGPHPERKIGHLSSMPFRIHKTTRRVPITSQAVTAVHGTKWMAELGIMCDAAEAKLTMNGKELIRPTSSDPSNSKDNPQKPKLHEGDLYLCSGSLNALEGALGGVCEGVDAVFQDGGPKRAFVCIRPPGHHCSAEYPSGFCWLNNVHVGINYAAIMHNLTHAAIIDFDLHHGDGSQSITWAHNVKSSNMPKGTPISKKTAIGYFSLHDINSYPCEMGDEEKVRNASLCLENAHGQSIWNVHLQPWKTNEEFWELYRDRYSTILAKARSFLRAHTAQLRRAPLHPIPKAAIFLSAGFDASEWESPGMQRHQVNVPTDFYARFTHDVVQLADEEGLGVDGRVISILEGGYSDRALMSGVLSHLSGLAMKNEPLVSPGPANGLGHEMSQRLGKLELNSHHRQGSGSHQHSQTETVDPKWWALHNLEEIDKLVNPPAPTAAPKKARSAASSTYSSATQSYTAKIITAPPNRRSFSGSSANHPSPVSSARAPSPPPPPVDWATAVHELSKLIVPSDRQTESCKPEDLNAEATRARRDRQSAIGLPLQSPPKNDKRMQLRGRKSKPVKYTSDEEPDKSASKAGRRKTIADVTTLTPDAPSVSTTSLPATTQKPIKSKTRRLSIASSATSINGERNTESSSVSTATNQTRQGPTVIKKGRAPSASRTEGTKARAVKAPPPVPRMPSNHMALNKPPLNSTASRKVTAKSLAEHDNLINREVYDMSASMKKMSIKLNVPSKEEQQAREAQRASTAHAVASGIPESTAAAVVNQQATASDMRQDPLSISGEGEVEVGKGGAVDLGTLPLPYNPSSLVSVTTENNAENQDASSQQLPKRSIIVDDRLNSEVPKIPSFVPPAAPAITAPALVVEDVGSTPNEKQEKENVVAQSEAPAIPSLPSPPVSPDSLTLTTPKRNKKDLPVFTSTSTIMFGKPSVKTGLGHFQESKSPTNVHASPPRGQHQLVGNATSIIPSTPPKQNTSEQSNLSLQDGVHEAKPSSQDIWDVPDSPSQLRAEKS